MKAIILLGAPGAGKGTLAERVRNATPYQHVSTGDMLRAAVKAATPTGLDAKGYMERGELVPDEVILRIIEERLASGAPDDAYMFDGFPRTIAQAKALDDMLARLGGAIGQVFVLDVPNETIVKRLSGRRICRGCGAVYNLAAIPPKVPGVCDHCGGNDLYQRPDDTEATVLNRLDVYEKQTAALIDYYREKGVLVRVDASTTPEAAAEDMLSKLK